jgi:hypothetical protein
MVRLSFLPEVFFMYLSHSSENPHFFDNAAFWHQSEGGTLLQSNSLAGADKNEVSVK